MDVFKVKYESEEDGDLYAISIVDNPANGFEFIAMSEQKEIKLSSDKKKQILYGIVLRPEQKIYREFEDGTPFHLTFDAETIVRFSQDFMKKSYQNNSTYNHEDSMKLSGTTIVENWIVMNKENDKGSAIGLPVEAGDWVVGMKLSDELWSEYIETGKAKGFSIDSFVQFEKIKMKLVDYSQEKVSRENNKNRDMSLIKKLIKLFSEGDINLATLETELGPLTADAFELGNVVYDANLAPVLNGEFIADGFKYYTDETGAIKEVEEVTPEEVVEEDLGKKEKLPMEEVETEIVAEVMIVTEDIAEEVLKPVEEIDVEMLKAKIEELNKQIENLTIQQEGVLTENTQLKEMVASTKLKAEVKGKSPIMMSNKDVSTESALDALSRITKKNNK